MTKKTIDSIVRILNQLGEADLKAIELSAERRLANQLKPKPKPKKPKAGKVDEGYPALANFIIKGR